MDASDEEKPKNTPKQKTDIMVEETTTERAEQKPQIRFVPALQMR